MSGREPPLLHGRPAGPRRPPSAFVPFPPPAGLPSLRTRGRGPSAPAGRPPPLPPAPRQRRGGLARGGGKGGSQRRARLSLFTRPPALRPVGRDPHRAGRPPDGAPLTAGAHRTKREDEPAPYSAAAALRGRRRPRPAAPRHRRDLPRPAPGSRPPREGVGRGGGRRTLPSPRRAGPGPRSGARDRQPGAGTGGARQPPQCVSGPTSPHHHPQHLPKNQTHKTLPAFSSLPSAERERPGTRASTGEGTSGRGATWDFKVRECPLTPDRLLNNSARLAELRKGGGASPHSRSQQRGVPGTTAARPRPIPGLLPRPPAARSAPPRLTTSPAANGPIGRRGERTPANQGLLTQASLHPLPAPRRKATAPRALPTPPPSGEVSHSSCPRRAGVEDPAAVAGFVT
ncbi:nascent polypeptide-associated complex subunit alpha, muscle-specific form-like [Physeter macrocephalus]|uniref:Nascent polypeptide-associated complex subunit alpha, muscle-specific form-like n=1 Tax=Physeter macrocephalus TaxID=9755 RepID=A0A455BNX6_PHYMC|nr:nascent polypeptide-associated complex subunit alpha, muscle-specific form-like [Physeter catodon]|eukprot:XP_028350649.1 nascent polypeptide-associated complex subunit alpha, muscle-specific form-like [Physeter catodon]